MLIIQQGNAKLQLQSIYSGSHFRFSGNVNNDIWLYAWFSVFFIGFIFEHIYIWILQDDLHNHKYN